MMRLNELYGFKNGDLGAIAEELAQVTGLEFEQRYADNSNGDYFISRSDSLGESDKLDIMLMQIRDPASDHIECRFAVDWSSPGFVDSYELTDSSRSRELLS